MKAQVFGPWIDLKPSELVSIDSLALEEEGVESAPSPYDVPMALRVDEGDAADPAYAFELRYLGGNERTLRNRVADLEIEVGEKSGRVYRVIVEVKANERRARAGVEKIAKDLEAAVHTLRFTPSVNVFLVGKAIETHADDLAHQLAQFATPA